MTDFVEGFSLINASDMNISTHRVVLWNSLFHNSKSRYAVTCFSETELSRIQIYTFSKHDNRLYLKVLSSTVIDPYFMWKDMI